MLAKQLVLENGEKWEAVSYEGEITLTRKDGGYEQYKEEWESEEELTKSMAEIAPLEQWQEYED